MKTLLSVLLIALLLFSCTGCALLLDLPSLEQAKDYFNNLYMQDEHESEGDEEDSYVYIEDDTSYGFYYDQLDENSRVVYRSIYLDSRNTAGIPIVFREPLSFPFLAEETEQVNETVRKAICSIVQPALDALVYDHPGISWISMDEENGSTFRVYSRRATNTDNSGTVQIKRLSFQLVYKAELTEEAIEENETAMKAALLTAGETIEEGANRHRILHTLQEHLCRTVTYESEAPRAHEAAGALLDGKAVCDGYAKAFKLLCDAYDIPCLIVVGTATQNGKNEPHAWNYVQMEDGKWYAIDVTWDDRGEEAKKNYFLVGAGTVTSMTLGHFESSHQTSGKFSAGEYTPFSLPELSFFRYTAPLLPGDWTREGA